MHLYLPKFDMLMKYCNEYCNNEYCKFISIYCYEIFNINFNKVCVVLGNY